MALLYRVIPDQYAHLFSEGSITKDGMTTEDLFYELGYINKSKHEPYLRITTDPLQLKNTPWQHTTGKGIYFFTSPWDCIENFSAIGTGLSMFSNEGVRILEYDIPDEIITVSHHGIGRYFGREVPEIKIPLELLQLNPNMQDTLPPELEEELHKVARKHVKEALEKLLPAVIKQRQNKNPISEQGLAAIYNTCTNPQRQEKLNNWRISNHGTFHKSDYITHRSFYVTLNDVKTTMYNANSIDEVDYTPIIESSNGVLTQENLAEYRARNKKHQL